MRPHMRGWMCVPLAALVPAVLLAAPPGISGHGALRAVELQRGLRLQQGPRHRWFCAEPDPGREWSTGLGYVNFNNAPSYRDHEQGQLQPW